MIFEIYFFDIFDISFYNLSIKSDLEMFCDIFYSFIITIKSI